VAITALDAGAQGGDPGSAQALFDGGLKDMLDRRYDSGCPKLEQSYALDPVPGALFTLAACYERWGKLHRAQQQYQRFVEMVAGLHVVEASKHDARVKNASAKLEELKDKVPTLTVSATGEAVEATVDGEPMAIGELGTARPLDPGEHRVVVKFAGGGLREETVLLGIADHRELRLAPLEGDAPGALTPSSPSEGDDGGASHGSAIRIAGFAIGGLGLAGVVVGAVTGGLVFSKKGVVEDNCQDLLCNAEGKAAADDAKTLGMVSNVSIGVGLGLVAAGVLMVVLAPDSNASSDDLAKSRLRVELGPGGGALSLIW
jgi:hypothetical protein